MSGIISRRASAFVPVGAALAAIWLALGMSAVARADGVQEPASTPQTITVGVSPVSGGIVLPPAPVPTSSRFRKQLV